MLPDSGSCVSGAVPVRRGIFAVALDQLKKAVALDRPQPKPGGFAFLQYSVDGVDHALEPFLLKYPC